MATRRTSDSTPSPKAVAPARAKQAIPPRADAAPAAKPEPAKSAAAQPAPVALKPATAKPEPRRRVAKPMAAPAKTARAEVNAETRRAMIAESAYLRAERRGFAPGHEAEDWSAAEREVDALLSADANAAAQ
jgi:hypothetical protein